MTDNNKDLNEMLKIKRDKLEELKQEGKDPHEIVNFKDRTPAATIKDKYDDYEGKSIRIAGRIIAKRGHGNMSFMDIQDESGTIQIVNRKNVIGDEFKQVKKYDIGDIVGIEGEVFKTKQGEISIETKTPQLLTKSLQMLPEKWHGLKDPDLRYRQRYLDLIVNPEVKEVFVLRSRIISEIRKFLDSRGFLEVETPILNTIAGGATARPFITHHNTLDIDMYLRIANELYLKRLIVGGFDRVYEMGRMFRNEGMDATHNPEYTAMELYQAYADYEDMMEIVESMIETVATNVLGNTVIEYDGNEIELKAPWKRVTMIDSIKNETGVDFNKITTYEDAVAIAKEKGVEVKETRGEIINEFFEEFVEDTLIQPTFIYDYPVEISPLAKRKKDDKSLTYRFEAFINGSEVGNAFSELNDAADQRERFEAQVAKRENGDDEAQMMDYDFVNALEVGLPPTGGLGIGIDRVIMLLTGQHSIRDVLLFPTMKPIGLEASGSNEAKASTNKHIEKSDEIIDFTGVEVEDFYEDVDFDTFSKSDFRVVKVKNCEEVLKSKKLLKFTLDDGSDSPRTILSGIKKYYTPEELIGKNLVAIVNLPPRAMMGEESQGMLLSAVHNQNGEEVLNVVEVSNRIPAGAKLY
ncbi:MULTISPECIES: lysine--tRNA ligase [Anaerococcus]|uniref:Lysine--tRNA ligase n=4 Tax=Anaerococcus TaxID=165779 RepID=A0A3E2TJA8_9FIRM|nr:MULTISPECIES: lysine--tRNA ligase [Anaerococcus]MBP2070335.1 lysyl-tRNA synthetase class 2 [Anaerococcus nagyae]MDU1828776.1 lysine--tRNA ligase [Anaerococcus sp.]MDU1864625.1 lysine--tRNA ligase [Anaerococcus sp.]RGB77090.1 lysine--tRNA ligase [Anaerococcus nagyae]